MIGVDEGARAVVDGLAGDGCVVGIHHPMNKADMHPLRDQCRLCVADPAKQFQILVAAGGDLGKMAIYGIVCQLAHLFHLTPGGKELKRAHPQVRRGHPRQNCPRLGPILPHHRFTR